MNSIYIGNLPYDATESQVAELFTPFGEVHRVALVNDRETGRPRGFGFVEMPSAEQAQAAIEALSGKDFQGRPLTVNPARNRSAQRNSANLSRSAQPPNETNPPADGEQTQNKPDDPNDSGYRNDLK